MLTANQLLDLLSDVLAEKGLSKSAIKSNYNNLKQKMSAEDARLFASVKFLRDLIADDQASRKANTKARLKKPNREEENDSER